MGVYLCGREGAGGVIDKETRKDTFWYREGTRASSTTPSAAEWASACVPPALLNSLPKRGR